MADLVQLVIIGLLAGGIYAAVGVGFGLVWGVLNIVNLAHGALVIIGAYLTWQIFSAFGLDPFLTLPIDAVALFVLGYAVQRGVINRIIRAPLLFTFLLTFGLNLIAVNVLLLIFKSDFRSVTTAYSGAGLELGGIVVPYIRLAALGVALVMAAALALLLGRTRVGLAIQAVGSDRDAAQLVGRSPRPRASRTRCRPSWSSSSAASAASAPPSWAASPSAWSRRSASRYRVPGPSSPTRSPSA